MSGVDDDGANTNATFLLHKFQTTFTLAARELQNGLLGVVYGLLLAFQPPLELRRLTKEPFQRLNMRPVDRGDQMLAISGD